MTTKVLVVDDESGMRRSLAIMLKREHYDVAEAASGQEAIERLADDVVDLVVADLRMEPVSGLELLRTVKRTTPDVEVILMTAHGTVESAVDAMKAGAFDFITKPFQQEEILLRVRNAVDKRRLTQEVAILRSEGIVGSSEPMRQLLRTVPRIAQTDSTVLITGESGTGKELVAKAIHGASRRGKGPFISVSCAALPEQLLENELFGHVKGAFTGAEAARKGLLEEAHTGTFFLDEIGEAPVSIQTKLLRVLEERSLRRLGDNRPVPIDVRIIAATNRDLEAAVREKVFREDLLYRLNVIRVHLPPLRERMEDVPLLARHFVALHRGQRERPLGGIAPSTLSALGRYGFPGNVRELSNIIEQAVALAVGPLIEPQDLPEHVQHPDPAPRPAPVPVVAPRSATSLREAVSSTEQEHLLEALRTASWNISRAAARLGVSRNTLRYRMEKYGLSPDADRGG